MGRPWVLPASFGPDCPSGTVRLNGNHFFFWYNAHAGNLALHEHGKATSVRHFAHYISFRRAAMLSAICASAVSLLLAANVSDPDAIPKKLVKDLGGKVTIVRNPKAKTGHLTVSVDLSRTAAADSDLKVIAKFRSLGILNLSGTKVTDAGLADLSSLKDIGALDLSETAITNSGLKHIAGLHSLIALGLHGTKVTDAGLIHLAALKNLRFLALFRTAVTDDGERAIKEALPKCAVIRKK
jgi:hypothetical protein